jgi:predicted phosphoadenosine phosphosulfate sulfurtransferase
MKKYKDINVYDATQKRLEFIFNEFDNIYLSFSGGKDSGVLLNLVIDFMKKNNITKKIGLFHQDFEAQYHQTTEYVNNCFENNLKYIEPFWCCNKIRVYNSLSSINPYWYTWDDNKLLVREYPKHGYIITDFQNRIKELENHNDYHMHYKSFSKYFHNIKNAKKTICLTGIRTDESLNRFRSINNVVKKYKNIDFIIETESNIYTAKPIYDWSFTDIFLANYKYNFDYNKIYDLFYIAGLPFKNMRVASPFQDTARDTLYLYRILAPDIWNKLLLRVEGVNYGNIYSNSKAFGKNFKLPKNHTWKSFTKFLLKTLPLDIRSKYVEKFKTSLKFWHKIGGVINDENLKLLDKYNIKYKIIGISNFSKKGLKQITFNQYQDSLDFINGWSLPSWKRFAITILKNDIACKTMGFATTKDVIFNKIKKIETAMKWSNQDD